MKKLARRWFYRRIEAALRTTFRRVEWVGPRDPPPRDRPLVVYANHHSFHDGYVLGFLLERVLRRRMIVWMEDWDRFPFFALGGALPFPPGDSARRARTVRQTATQMSHDPSTVLLYFPDGELRPYEMGIDIPDGNRCRRIDRVLPNPLWWPVALRIAGFHEAQPTALLAGGKPHAGPDGAEAGQLRHLLAQLEQHPLADLRTTLLDGRPGPDERWNFSFLARAIEKLYIR